MIEDTREPVYNMYDCECECDCEDCEDEDCECEGHKRNEKSWYDDFDESAADDERHGL